MLIQGEKLALSDYLITNFNLHNPLKIIAVELHSLSILILPTSRSLRRGSGPVQKAEAKGPERSNKEVTKRATVVINWRTMLKHPQRS